MKDFTTSRHCESGKHCQACRGNAQWRAIMSRDWIMPETCPHKDGRKVYHVPDDACDFCEKCEKPRSCPNVKSCCGGRIDVNFIAPCPKGLWKMIEE